MSNKECLITYLFLIVLLVGCKEQSNQPVSDIPQSTQVVLVDSLKKLDSLVLKSRTNKINESLKYGHIANKIAHLLKNPESFAKTYILMGNAYSVFKMDSSFYYYNKALVIIDSFRIAKYKGIVLYNLGMLYNSANNYKTSISFLDSALISSQLIRDFALVSNSLNSLGNIYFEIGDDTNARKMYDSAFIVAKRNALFLQMGAALGNLAKLETNLQKSIILNKTAISYLIKSKESDEQIVMILINIANNFTNPDSALHYFNKALKIVNPENSPEAVIGLYNNLACTYIDMGDLGNAKKCIIEHALPIAMGTHNVDWQSTIYDTYSDLLHKDGDLQGALIYEKKSIELMGVANKQSALKQIRLLAAMLDLKNKESIIKNEKTEVEQTRLSLRNRNQLIIILCLVIVTLLSFFIVWIQKKRFQLQNQQLESAKKLIEAEENEKAKIGRDFHDLTGQKFLSLTGFLTNIEFNDQRKKIVALNMVKEINDIVREISHRMNASWIERFTLEKSIKGLCIDFKKINQLDIELRAPDEYPVMLKDTKIHIFRIIQELLSNSVKHSLGAKVVLDITFDLNTFTLKYNDNGPGFIREQVRDKGVGLSNLFERVKLLAGTIELDTHPGFGTSYLIRIPIIKKKSLITTFSG